MEPLDFSVETEVEHAARAIIQRLDKHPFRVGEQIMISGDTAICAVLLASFVLGLMGGDNESENSINGDA